MQRRRIAVAAAVVAATGAAVAFTLPSMAGTNSSARPAARPAAADDVAPQLLAAMRRDLGLDATQARTRLQRAEWAGKTSATLAAQTGSEYGGAWLAKDGTTLKIAVTDKAAAKQVEAAGAEAVLVKRSEQALDTAKEKLDEARSAAGDLTSWYVDPASNKVVVVAKPGDTAAAWEFAEQAGVARSAVEVKTSSAQPKPLFDVRGGDPYFINRNARCSIGFSVTTGFVTAGHCGPVGSTTTGFNQQAQGVTQASVFPGSADMGFVKVEDNWDPKPVVNDFKGNELPVAGNTESPVGAAICRSGSTTGTFCGTVLAKNQTVNYPEGAVTGLTRTNVCAEGGDSGGPWLTGDQAQGVTSGGSGDCTRGGETFFQPLNEILVANNLTLVTTGGQAPPSQAPPATAPPTTAPPAGEEGSLDCSSLPVQRDNSLRSRQRHMQPDGGAFRAGAGRHTACLDAPAGADFDLGLQLFIRGEGFKTVASQTGTGDKQLTFSGPAGTYRYVVVSTSGSGAYNLGFNVS